VPTLYAERSLRAVNLLLPIARRRPRWSWRVWRRISLGVEPLGLELAIPRAIAAAEDFLLMRATECLHPRLLESVASVHSPDPVRTRLQQAAKRFDKLQAVWRDDLLVDPTSLTDWNEFERWRDLRHVLVHRLGYWQPALDPKPRLRDRIARLGENPELYRGQIPLASDDLIAAVANAKALVLEADGRVPTPMP
jgi:hypothetical protein